MPTCMSVYVPNKSSVSHQHNLVLTYIYFTPDLVSTLTWPLPKVKFNKYKSSSGRLLYIVYYKISTAAVYLKVIFVHTILFSVSVTHP